MRRLIDSRLLTRLTAHALVIGLVASAAALGLSQGSGQATAGGSVDAFFVSTARAGAESAVEAQPSTTFELAADPAAPPEFISRGAPAAVPTTDAPKPVPVPVDPNAPPLPAPYSASVGTTTRSAQGTQVVSAPVGGGLAWPVPAGSVSQHYSAGHLALDVAASAGSAVVAAEAGVVSSAGWRSNGGGLVVSIDHGNGMVTVYNHLGSVWVNPGQVVSRGQGIGGVGCTGLCTGPHVHFEVLVGGVSVNPLRYL